MKNNLFISFEQGAVCVNAAQVKFVRTELVSSEGVAPKIQRWYRHNIYLAGEEEPLVTYSEKWWSCELESAAEYCNEIAMEDEHSIQNLLYEINETLKASIPPSAKDEPPMPPRQSPLDDDGA